MASDSFNRAAEDPLGSPWAAFIGATLRIVTNGYCQNSSAGPSNASMLYSSSSVADSKIVYTGLGSAGGYTGPVIHGANSGATSRGYYARIIGTTLNVRRIDNAAFTTLKTFTVSALQVGDSFRLMRFGDNTLRVYVNGTELGESDRSSDTTYTDGSPGLITYDADAYFDSWTDEGDPAAGIPTLSNPTVTAIDRTQATPRVTVTF
jgi:hypothetical protein